jgi:hypothetical protein
MNSAVQLKDYFSTPDRPVSAKEMTEFWKSLSDEEREYYKTADLS